MQPVFHFFCIVLLGMLPVGLDVQRSATAQSPGQTVRLSLKQGSVITAQTDDTVLSWNEVKADGQTTLKKIKIADIKQLVLTSDQVSQQVADVRRQLELLGSPDYHKRETAEQKLADPDLGGLFVTMIKSKQEHENYEVRYRVGRILDKLESSSGQSTRLAELFDRLTLNNGTTLEGGAVDLKLKCKYRGRELVFTRDDLIAIAAPATFPRPSPSGTVDVKMFHSHQGEFYLPNQTVIDFETGPSGNDLPVQKSINDAFVARGIQFSTEKKGYVGIPSKFKFKNFGELPVGGFSACTFESTGRFLKRFKGTLEISFCMPGEKSVSAGVNEFGLFLANCTHSRDLIVEAYNASGQILACVESTDEKIVFAGVKSSEPIAKVRVLQNPYLFRVDRELDDDYAIDSVCFSSPVPVGVSQTNPTGFVELTNGDILGGRKIRLDDSGAVSVAIQGRPIKIPQTEVRAIKFANKQPTARKGQWMAALPDRSILSVRPGQAFTSEQFAGLSFKPDQLLAIWPAQNNFRFPVLSDFEKSDQVMVFPTCRIAADVSFTAQGYSWKNATKIEEPLSVRGNEDPEDPTPTNTSIKYSDTPENTPTLWQSPPKVPDQNAGLLRLTDGQQFVLGEKSRFKLGTTNGQSTTILIDGKETQISLSRVLSIEFPR